MVTDVPALEFLGLRVIWSVPFLIIVLFVLNDFRILGEVLRSPWKYRVYFASAFLLATNWYVWIWSVINGYVVDASLGYFINPLLNVVMGVLLLHEHLRRVQWISLFLALAGVLYLTLSYGQFPWIALTLAGAFALYGYIRKTAALGATNGLTAEISLLLIPSILLLLYLNNAGTLILPSVDLELHFWISVSGLITVIPLSLFAYGARRIPYSTLGFIQYIAPTSQFLLGVFLFQENFNTEKLIGFSFIWLALLIYSFENFLFHKKRKNSSSI
jgi:chloramphenicol-sensitive protein RarD